MTTPSLSKQQWYFRSAALDQSHDSFRVIKLPPRPTFNARFVHPQPRTHCISRVVSSALSYTWAACASPRWIQLNGKPFMVQRNLFAALKAIRCEDEEMWVWADSICIFSYGTTMNDL
ncbi:uncharacterized protein BDZ99DRAFT_235589 [Mytilinidion resinicola]|uniref:Heterokaryon incompatibility domain-containing protein n=1 Tax=Mytilinidion resinicola TaxID=574789 RepID=A0A6A6Z2F9_9PEZI|nr:uncharacterized protein BDZ99DRAFT_235589 [Mytilinidion resinicola]KAF2814365.1 hypothetical protein BDZ99DRAFT_235589 [Mytilinidion resinicola]